MMFEHFDFSILRDPYFKEDGVREELIVPILNKLGYTATGEHRILRTRPLVHPYVYIGTRSHKISIFPDYLLCAAGEARWVLDAKNPGENIRDGKNVEQAYSYAIHKDVRVQLYGLCNGHEFVVFHTSKLDPVLAVDLEDVERRWDELNALLSPIAFINPALLTFQPDFGLTLLKMGNHEDDQYVFPMLELQSFSRAADDLYIVTSHVMFDRPYCITFDFSPPMFDKLLKQMGPGHRDAIHDALTHLPYQIWFPDNLPAATIRAQLGETVQENENESYLPLTVVDVGQ